MKTELAKAPDLEVLFSDGAHSRLSEFWEAGPSALVFLRHFG
jgi:hypothetical protein